MTRIAHRSTSLLGTITLLTAAACSKPAPVPPAPEVTVAPAIERASTEWDDFTGHFDAIQSVEVRPRVSGFIDRIAFPEGATVNQGDVLLTIDPRPYEAEVARAEAVLEQARTHQSLAKQELDRANTLVNTQAISREELDSRASSFAEASAAVRAADAALRNAKLNLEWTTVRAPISGRVGRAQITAGNLVSPATSLLTTIVSLDPIFVYFDSDEQAYLRYMSAGAATRSRGQPVLIGLANETGFPHQGTLDFVDNRVDQAAGTMRIRAVVRNADHRFAPGMFARVRLAGGAQRLVTMIQDEAIGTDQDRKFVLVLKPDTTVEYRAISVGAAENGLRVVESGLKPGETIVINGLLRVRPGMKVAPKRATMLAAR